MLPERARLRRFPDVCRFADAWPHFDCWCELPRGVTAKHYQSGLLNLQIKHDVGFLKP